MMSRPAEKFVDAHGIRIYHGDADQWVAAPDEHVDLVFTNPYGYLPPSLLSHPMLIHQWVHRQRQLEHWARNYALIQVGLWNKGREAFWVANMPEPVKVDVSQYCPEPGGWYPEQMVRDLLFMYGPKEGGTVWDGFMGRGTIAKVCREMGYTYIGVEQLGTHIDIAREYLGI